MAKTKLKKKTFTSKGKSVNPFEIRVNKQKFDVLGRKSKNDRGLPGVARAKSIKKRKETLLKEHRIMHKSNIFMDRRIGQNKKSSLSQDESLTARFKIERLKDHNKKTMFNLADDEVLTHRGKTLSEIENFDDPRSDEEEDEFNGRSGGLEANVVEAHFGGGLFREAGEGANSHASLIDELIAESKKRKAERQRAKEQTLELTDKLDADWHELLPLVGTGKASEDTELKPQKGSYDQLMRELKFESRGVPTDRLKSEDELAKEEKEKLEKLEKERLRRMKGLEEVKIAEPKHRSADDLDDGFDIDSDIGDDNDDEGISENNISHDGGISSDDENEASDDEIDGGSGACSSSNDLEVEKEEIKRSKDYDPVRKEKCVVSNKVEKEKHGKDKEEDEESSCSDSSVSDIDDDLSDLKIHSDNEEQDDADLGTFNKTEEIFQSPKNKNSTDKIDETNSENFIESLKKKKQQMEDARRELPYTFKIPETYDELESVMEGHNVEKQGIIIERMIKCNHPSLGENNKEKLEELFVFLLQYLNDADDEVVWKLLDNLSPHLYDLVQFFPEHSAKCIIQIMKEKYEDLKKHSHKFPLADTLVFLKLIPLLFPTSDIRHQVTTPATVFLIQLLNQCRVHGRRAISTGLFVVSLLLEYTTLSKRYSPEVVNFLQGILEMAILGVKVSLPYSKSGYHPLVLDSCNEIKSDHSNTFSFNELSSNSQIDNQYRLTALSTTIKLISCLCDQLEDIPSVNEILGPIDKLLKKLEISKYPNYLKEEISNLEIKIKKCYRKLNYLILEKKKPKALRLYEPLIQRVIEGKKNKDMSEEQAEHQKLLAKYKREMKGALREIRRDNAFLAKVNLHDQAKRDEERRRKVKEIYGWGADQAHELKSLKRRKKK